MRAQSWHDPVESCDGKEEKGLEGWKEREKNERERKAREGERGRERGITNRLLSS